MWVAADLMWMRVMSTLGPSVSVFSYPEKERLCPPGVRDAESSVWVTYLATYERATASSPWCWLHWLAPCASLSGWQRSWSSSSAGCFALPPRLLPASFCSMTSLPALTSRPLQPSPALLSKGENSVRWRRGWAEPWRVVDPGGQHAAVVRPSSAATPDAASRRGRRGGQGATERAADGRPGREPAIVRPWRRWGCRSSTTTSWPPSCRGGCSPARRLSGETRSSPCLTVSPAACTSVKSKLAATRDQSQQSWQHQEGAGSDG